MPFVYDETEIEWPDDDSEPPPPRPDQFVYLAPPQFGGAREPFRFSIMAPGAATGESDRRKKLAQQHLAIMVPALREIGGRGGLIAGTMVATTRDLLGWIASSHLRHIVQPDKIPT
jgi:hypothetical protein